MVHHRSPVLGTEPGVFAHDVGNRSVDLPDVVKERHTLDASPHSFIRIGGSRERERVIRNAANVSARFGVIGIDCVEQYFECGSSQALQRAAFPPLAIVESTCSRTG
jgi:hypothetical protein